MPRQGRCWELLLLLLLGLEVRSLWGCPVDCVCYPAPMTVSCQSHHFSALPEGIPRDSERLFLQNNRISRLPRGHLSPGLVTLWVYSNNLTFVDPQAFRGLAQLEELDLGDNRHLRELAPETFRGLARLHALHLYQCGLRALPAGLFGGLHSLQYLYLQDNQLEALPEDLFADLANLSHLFLHGNRLAALPPHAFRGLPQLDRLLLHQNRLQSVHRRAFQGLARLTLLFLFNNSLAQLPGEALAPLAALEYLRLNGNPWDCGCRAHSLWDWLRRFRGSSSGVPCGDPAGLRGQDLKELPAALFRPCLASSESRPQSHGPPRDHPRPPPPPRAASSAEKGPRPGYRKPGKNCTKSRHRTTQPASLGPWKGGPEMRDFEHKAGLGLLPKPKGKCPQRTALLPPSGVQQAAGGILSAGARGVGAGAALLAALVALAVIVR
ncbi:reticulon-4 receptor-like 1 [Hemicordylus capensis]|uniref:reticulon-4 receptor-like 1 n=1 Tax=Hemicordylus capensis TaxID=884348 RepID=UPI002303C887|nr:reticulon-4 receptor-like 1 [Hemicordylus capensis]